MDDSKPVNDSNDQGLNKIDLSQLQAFSFGTQWTEVKPVSPPRRERDSDRGGERPDRRDGPSAPSRDRRTFRKPAGPSAPGPGGASEPRREGPGGEPRRFERGPGGPRRDFRGGERREGGEPFERQPYFSPHFSLTCYPEDTGFAAMVKAVRASCRTFQLFEITRAVLEKNDRFIVVIHRTRPSRPDQPAPVASEGAAPENAPTRTDKPAPLFMSLPDHLPFDTEEAAIQHVLKNHFGQFFDLQEVEIDPPKGNFPIINKCGITGELLGPPNYHRYQQMIQQHHATRLNRMPFEKFRDSIVSAREPEVIAQWLEKMKKATRYSWKTPAPKTASTPPVVAPVAEIAPAMESAPLSETPTPDAAPTPASEVTAPPPTDAVPVAAAPAGDAPAVPPVAEVALTPAPITFDSFDEARAHLLAHARDKVVRAVESVRFHGRLIEKLPPGEIRRAVEGHVERQRRYPLDSANALRGRLRRESFTIFKKGSRGISYVCAVKRRFRVPGQVFSESITGLIDFIEKHPMVPIKDLPKNFLGIDIAAALASGPLPEGMPPSQAPFAVLPPEQAEKLHKVSNDLRWLVMEGYVTEFSDGKLFAPPPMVPQTARKTSDEEEHDPVDFPEATAASTAAAPTGETMPAPEAQAAPGAETAPAPEVAAHGESAPAESAPGESAPAPEAPAPAAMESEPTLVVIEPAKPAEQS